MRGVKTAPPPYVLEPPMENKHVYAPGEKMQFNLILIGRAQRLFPAVLSVFDQLGDVGLGKKKGRFKVTKVDCWMEGWRVIYKIEDQMLDLSFSKNAGFTPEQAPPGVNQLALQFQTPTRIKRHNKLLTRLDFRELTYSMLRRISTLAFFHMPEQQISWDWKPWLDKADKISIKSQQLYWGDWQRYSNRQKTSMMLGGFKGEVTFTGELAPFLSLLRIGEILHVGKSTTFGLGKYLITNFSKH